MLADPLDAAGVSGEGSASTCQSSEMTISDATWRLRLPIAMRCCGLLEVWLVAFRPGWPPPSCCPLWYIASYSVARMSAHQQVDQLLHQSNHSNSCSSRHLTKAITTVPMG